MGDQVSQAPDACPDFARWLDVAAGNARAEMSESLTRHAAGCAACASRLREAIQVMADDEDPADNRLLASLQSSDPAWQKELAKKLAAAPAPAPQRRRTLWTWRFAVPV